MFSPRNVLQKSMAYRSMQIRRVPSTILKHNGINSKLQIGNEAAMSNTLGLDDDLDDVELLQDIEQTFALRFSQAEAEKLYRVEDVYNYLRNRIEADGLNQRCATALAFYRLRRALAGSASRQVLRPSTELTPFVRGSANRLFRKLNRETGLRMPRTDGWWLSHAGASLCLASLFAILPVAIFDWSFWIPLSLFLAGIVAAKLDPGQLPVDCKTLGELSRRVAGLNFAKMQKLGAAARDKDVWNAMIEVIAQHSALPKEQIGPETFLLQASPAK